MTNQSENNSGSKRRFGNRPLFIILIIGFSLLCWQVVSRSELYSSPDNKSLPENWPDMRLNINTATSAELTLLPGIGDGLSEKIVEYRTINGNFQTVDDLDLVPGIGLKTIDRFKHYVVAE